MSRHAFAGSFALVFIATLALAGQSENTEKSSWSGVIINGSCTVDEAFAEAAKCTADSPGATLALYDDTEWRKNCDQGKTRISGLRQQDLFLAGVRAGQWEFQIVSLDRQRAPEDIRHK